MSDALVIVPTFNERDNLTSIVHRIREAVPAAHVLIVDDASTDGTGRLADGIAESDQQVRVLHRPGKAGLGSAYLAGFAHAGVGVFDYVVEIDADGSHDPAELPAMLALAAAGSDLVIGSRWVAGGRVKDWPWWRQAISRTGNRYARIALGSRIHDITAGFRVYRSEVLGALTDSGVASQGYCFQVEMAWRAERAGMRVVEHPITFVERTAGRSKMHTGIVLEALWRVTGWGIKQRVRPSGRTRVMT